jgi:hypothetical protein
MEIKITGVSGTGHVPVQNDQIEAESAGAESSGYPKPIGCSLDLISATTQRLHRDRLDPGVIIDDEDSSRTLFLPRSIYVTA